MKKKKQPVVYAFIDSQNLNLAIRDQGWKLDFARFRHYLEDKYRVGKAFLFIGFIPKNQSLYKELKIAGYQIVFKPILVHKKRGNIIVKGNVDAELVLHTMIQYPNYKKAILVTGDGDFHCLVEYLEKKKKLGRLLIPNQKKYSQLFLKFKSDIDFMNNLKQKLAIKKGSVALRTKP